MDRSGSFIRTAGRTVTYLTMAVVGFLGMFYLVHESGVAFGGHEDPGGNSPILRPVYAFALTLVGVFLGSSYRRLSALADKGHEQIESIGGLFKGVFRSIDLWMGLLGAPILFGLIWQSMGTGSLAGITVIALENGFCCNVLINTFLEKKRDAALPQRNVSGTQT